MRRFRGGAVSKSGASGSNVSERLELETQRHPENTEWDGGKPKQTPGWNSRFTALCKVQTLCVLLISASWGNAALFLFRMLWMHPEPSLLVEAGSCWGQTELREHPRWVWEFCSETPAAAVLHDCCCSDRVWRLLVRKEEPVRLQEHRGVS